MQHTPTVLQMETTECGAASLAVILQHHGRHVPMSQLRDACGVSRDGTNAAAIQAAARLYGLEVDGFMAEDTKELRLWKRPVILHWKFNHFLVLEGISGRNVMLNDPAIGRRRVTLAEFERSFTGVFLDLKPGSSFRRGGHPPRFWGAIAQRLALEKAGVLFTLITGLVLVLPQVLIPVFSQVYIDEIWGQGLQAWLKPMLWALVLVLMLQTVMKHLQLTAIRRLARRLDSRFSAQFERHVLSLPERYFSQRYSGDINGRVELNREVASFLAEQLIPLLSGVMLLVFYLVLTLSYSPWLGGVVGISTGLNALLVAFSHHAHQEDSLRLQQDGAKAQSVVTAAIRDIETVKTAAVEADLATRFGGHLSTALNGSQRIGLRQARLELVPGLLNQVNNLAVLIVGFVLVLRGDMTLGMVLAAQQVGGGLKGEIDRWLAFMRGLPKMQASLLRLEDVLGEPVDPLVDGRPCSMDAEGGSRLSGAITLEAISFGYIPTQEPLLGPIDLKVAAGQRLALVGGSGSGKSTLARLLAGLERASSGMLLLDGTRLEEIPRSVRVGSIAMVQQEVQLYGVTVRDNLTLWNRAIPQERIEEACRDAQILADIQQLPQGFDTVLMEGGRSLSGGQRQRLEIARALLQDPSILILDEATSALDATTEQRVLQALQRRACTQIMIAHRLSAVLEADLILVLKCGQVVQQGSHRELLQDASGTYAQLVGREQREENR